MERLLQTVLRVMLKYERSLPIKQSGSIWIFGGKDAHDFSVLRG
jgi:hypothetical protein